MNGFIRNAAASLCVGAGALTLMGCTQYRAHVDPCWPERYDNESRQNIRSTFDAQAANGHTLDQTLWNWDFERDEKGNPTDKLSIGGQERLKYLIRRRPVPDGRLYMQTANDLPSATTIEQFAEKRQELDTKRIASVQRHLSALMAGRSMPVAWDIAVHDPDPAYLPANVAGGAAAGSYNSVTGAYPKLITNFQGVFGNAVGFSIPTGGGGGQGEEDSRGGRGGCGGQGARGRRGEEAAPGGGGGGAEGGAGGAEAAGGARERPPARSLRRRRPRRRAGDAPGRQDDGQDGLGARPLFR